MTAHVIAITVAAVLIIAVIVLIHAAARGDALRRQLGQAAAEDALWSAEAGDGHPETDPETGGTTS